MSTTLAEQVAKTLDDRYGMDHQVDMFGEIYWGWVGTGDPGVSLLELPSDFTLRVSYRGQEVAVFQTASTFVSALVAFVDAMLQEQAEDELRG